MLFDIADAKATVIRMESQANTFANGRAVSEQILHLDLNGKAVALPVAVVSDGENVRIYHSTWPLTGGHKLRGPVLPATTIPLPDVIRDYQAALAAGDLEKIVATFEPDGEVREPSGGEFLYQGENEIRRIYQAMFQSGGGILLDHCTVTDDGVRCAIEYNVVQWGKHKLPPQCGMAVYERSGNGKLRAARIYDDVAPPAGA